MREIPTPDLSELSEPDQHREVYAFAGLALYWSQCVEKSVVLLTWMARTTDGTLSAEFASHEEFLEHFDRKTLGQLLHASRKHIVFNDDDVGRTLEALRLRNFVVHAFFHERIELFASQRGRQLMAEELASTARHLMVADEALMGVVYRLGSTFGITRERVEQELAAAKARWANYGSV